MAPFEAALREIAETADDLCEMRDDEVGDFVAQQVERWRACLHHCGSPSCVSTYQRSSEREIMARERVTHTTGQEKRKRWRGGGAGRGLGTTRPRSTELGRTKHHERQRRSDRN
jgi:hypothetical protein